MKKGFNFRPKSKDQQLDTDPTKEGKESTGIEDGAEQEQQPFEIGQQVRVKRTSGEFEDDWQFVCFDPHKDERVIVQKEGRDLTKSVDTNELKSWQEGSVEEGVDEQLEQESEPETRIGEEGKKMRAKDYLRELIKGIELLRGKDSKAAEDYFREKIKLLEEEPRTKKEEVARDTAREIIERAREIESLREIIEKIQKG